MYLYSSHNTDSNHSTLWAYEGSDGHRFVSPPLAVGWLSGEFHNVPTSEWVNPQQGPVVNLEMTSSGMVDFGKYHQNFFVD